MNEITYFGHSAFQIVTSKGLHIWIDPWLDNPKAPKKTGPTQADVILLTHAHGDHLGNAIAIARSSSAEVVAIHEIQQYLLGRGVSNVTGMNIGGTYQTKGLTITMVMAVHSSSIQEHGSIIYGGEPAGFVVRLEDGFVLYHAGDTALFNDMSLIGELYKPDVAMLPIGSHYVMGPKEAAYAAKLIGAPKVIPMHYGTFPALSGTVKEFAGEIEKRAPNVVIEAMSPGQTLTLGIS